MQLPGYRRKVCYGLAVRVAGSCRLQVVPWTRGPVDPWTFGPVDRARAGVPAERVLISGGGRAETSAGLPIRRRARLPLFQSVASLWLREQYDTAGRTFAFVFAASSGDP